ncbi:tRNA-specific adenosine deaminase [Anaerocolumna cellulosilytica]|uniref:tRNA-specific adenosine deaminase n=1 Tax=Anaerocolumna cellulosilytica TaxID=433286 RepID=A0A6S6R1S5_9FIRM|nr:tRNA adenosine(34) deaminase TadA [Anaerocolumna cellulosilytica]MBB5195854.1 tRNA(adenine34) deaminase [Anaerocolumna cellulosilytica]BCJ96864.1 tRNA-specific adenosine deaminase [Anaerocolumna cellulosilytica]
MNLKYMKEAIKEAKKAAKKGEVPIGCVIVYDDKIIGRGHNKRNTNKTTLAHAELLAIQKASKTMGDWRLEDCTMYITLEPCQMCSGAIVQARIKEVIVGAMNPKAGCAGSILNILQMKEFNHQVELETGVMEEECSQVLKEFFVGLRERNKQEKQVQE